MITEQNIPGEKQLWNWMEVSGHPLEVQLFCTARSSSTPLGGGGTWAHRQPSYGSGPEELSFFFSLSLSDIWQKKMWLLYPDRFWVVLNEQMWIFAFKHPHPNRKTFPWKKKKKKNVSFWWRHLDLELLGILKEKRWENDENITNYLIYMVQKIYKKNSNERDLRCTQLSLTV